MSTKAIDIGTVSSLTLEDSVPKNEKRLVQHRRTTPQAMSQCMQAVILEHWIGTKPVAA